MKEHGILFSSEMVRAILAGTKSQTRRLITPQPELALMDKELKSMLGTLKGVGLLPSDHKIPRWRWRGTFSEPWPRCIDNWSPYGRPGDRLWVRETWAALIDEDTLRTQGPANSTDTVVYRASDYADAEWPGFSWRPSIFMPRWASRITLEVTSVRAERLQDISEADARAEGVKPLQMDMGSCLPSFEGLWDSLNEKKAPWVANPWVWVVSFRIARKAAV